MKHDEQLPDVWQPMESAPTAQPGMPTAQAASYASLERTQVFSRAELEPAPKPVAPNPVERRPSLVATKLFSWAELGLESPAPNREPEPVLAAATAPVPNGTLIIDRRELLGTSGAAFSSTRILPIEQWLGAPGPEQRTAEVERVTLEPPAPEPARSTAFGARIAASYRAAPASRKLTWALLPLALPAALFIVLGGSGRAKLPPKKAPHANAQVAPSTRAPAAAAVAPAPKPLSLPALRPGQSLERAAADAVAEGNTALAAAYYRELAAREPERAVYRAGLRILEARLAAGAPRP